MPTNDFLSDPAVQQAMIALASGLLLGFSHNITRRLLEAAAALVAIGLIFLIATGQTETIKQFDFPAIKIFLTQWRYVIAALTGGWILGYSIFERRQPRG